MRREKQHLITIIKLSAQEKALCPPTKSTPTKRDFNERLHFERSERPPSAPNVSSASESDDSFPLTNYGHRVTEYVSSGLSRVSLSFYRYLRLDKLTSMLSVQIKLMNVMFHVSTSHLASFGASLAACVWGSRGARNFLSPRAQGKARNFSKSKSLHRHSRLTH